MIETASFAAFVRATPVWVHALRALASLVLALLLVGFGFGVWACSTRAVCPLFMYVMSGLMSMIATPFLLGFGWAEHDTTINLWPFIAPIALVFFLAWSGLRYLLEGAGNPGDHA